MPFDFKSLKPMGKLASAQTGDDGAIEQRVVSLRAGCEAPDYVTIRARFGPRVMTVDVKRSDLQRLMDDPAIHKVDPPEHYKLIE